MKLERRLPVGFIERVPLLVALAVVAGWLACLGARGVTMRWEARGVTRPGLRRAYHLRLPALRP